MTTAINQNSARGPERNTVTILSKAAHMQQVNKERENVWLTQRWKNGGALKKTTLNLAGEYIVVFK